MSEINIDLSVAQHLRSSRLLESGIFGLHGVDDGEGAERNSILEMMNPIFFAYVRTQYSLFPPFNEYIRHSQNNYETYQSQSYASQIISIILIMAGYISVDQGLVEVLVGKIASLVVLLHVNYIRA